MSSNQIRIAFVLLAVCSVANGQGIFKCIDASGKTTFNEFPCPKNSQSRTIVPPPEVATSVANSTPKELLQAYHFFLSAIAQRNTNNFFSSMSNRESSRIRSTRSIGNYFPEDRDDRPVQVIPISGRLDRRKGTGSIVVNTRTGTEEEVLTIDFLLESNKWKIDTIKSGRP
jgi:hypothetical protein